MMYGLSFVNSPFSRSISQLHTNAGCTMGSLPMSGTSLQQNCDVAVTDNEGCTVQQDANENSFGPNYNSNGGGVHVFLWTEESMKMWFFPVNFFSCLNLY